MQMTTNKWLIGGLVGTLGLAVVYLLARPAQVVVATPATVQQVACMYDGYYSFVAENISSPFFSEGNVRFRNNRDGNVLMYKMREGETCRWDSAVEGKDLLIKEHPAE